MYTKYPIKKLLTAVRYRTVGAQKGPVMMIVATAIVTTIRLILLLLSYHCPNPVPSEDFQTRAKQIGNAIPAMTAGHDATEPAKMSKTSCLP